MSANARRRSASASARSRTSTAAKARKSACACSSDSATRPSPPPTFRAMRWKTLVERALAMAAEAPEDQYAGLAPKRCCSAATGRPRPRRWRRSRSGRAQGARAGRRRCGAARRGCHQSSGGAAPRLGLHHLRDRHQRRLRRPDPRHRLQQFGSVVAGEGATMQRDYAWHSARHLADLEAPEEIGRAPPSARSPA